MLKRVIKTVTVAVTIVCLVVCMFPIQAFADPVSATIVANAFAQAIAAYGAANGVSMTFDVSSTSSIGESVHELWKDFREGTQDADDYATLAAALFPDLYYKAATAVGTASDIYTVGFNISAEYAEEFDNFYNWLLSGPAEMVQVDNQYYQFQQAQIGPNSSPINIYFGGGTFTSLPIITDLSASDETIYGLNYYMGNNSADNQRFTAGTYNNSATVYPFAFLADARGRYYYGYLSTNQFSIVAVDSALRGGNWTYSRSTSNSSSYTYNNATFYRWQNSSLISSDYVWNIPIFNSSQDAYNAFLSFIEYPNTSSLGVKAYDNTGIADIPDTADPNYDALHRAREIPTDIPWDDTIYGDGTGTLTDSQTEAIASDVDLTLVEDGVIELVEEGVEPAPTPNEVVIPFLPVGLPSFNFSFSGIWHYVREWVSSLGAWFATLFTIWSALPYAMVVPVYATAVVVIVLGVYKRFFM